MTIKSIIKEDIQYEKSERTELTTSKIIDAAINEFGKNGYLGGTVNNICNTGINKGLLYHNFKGKDDLYLTCLNFSCQKLLNYLKEQDRTENLENYMSARMNFFSNNPNESRIFFEALLSPPLHLSDKVNQIISEFNALNEKMYNTTLDSIILRDGISRDDAISYFHKIKMPSILGWLIVGMIFGPHAIQLMPQSVLEAGWYKTIIMWMQCAFGKYFGARIGASITHMPNTVCKYLGLTLLPHSGVSLVFTGIICSTLSSAPELVQIVQGTIAAAATINEFIAVIAAKKALNCLERLNRND